MLNADNQTDDLVDQTCGGTPWRGRKGKNTRSLFWTTTKTWRLRAPIGPCSAIERICLYFGTTLLNRRHSLSGCSRLTSSVSCVSGPHCSETSSSAFPISSSLPRRDL